MSEYDYDEPEGTENEPEGSEWDIWLEDHIKGCSICDKAFNECDGGMCETAFVKM